jgi:hypothetical protein
VTENRIARASKPVNVPRRACPSVRDAPNHPNVTKHIAATPDNLRWLERPATTIMEGGKTMRVIVTAVPGAMPEPADILAMGETNPDGGGVSWWDRERLRVFKNVDPLKVVGFIYGGCVPDSFRHAWRG